MKKNRFFLMFSVIGIAAITFVSCNRDQSDNNLRTEETKVTKAGRFDNKAFTWDIKTSNRSDNETFLGDLNVQNLKPSAGISSGAVARANEDFFPNNPMIYPGATFLHHEAYASYSPFTRELREEKAPYDLNFMFSNPYVIRGVENQGSGFSTYNENLSKALNSSNYKDYINSGAKRETDYSATECYSYSDVEKAFSANAGFGKIFTAKMTSNSKKINTRSIYLARLISTSFDVIFEPNREGFFKSKSINDLDKKKSKILPPEVCIDYVELFQNTPEYILYSVYAQKVSYGRFAFVAIESEYSYSEVKKAIESTFNLWKISAGAKYDEKTTEVMSKSVVTLYSNGDNTAESFWGTSLDGLKSVFDVKYNQNFYGYPIYAYMKSFLREDFGPGHNNIPDHHKKL
ncbi:thiol-activated cytolysin family protein [Elizabethkingia occulta]|uniref:thiol-activated cytolysin family protein n=1 Tax=Elizabethkingia occulta TaxID=1867263 RepID=UPI001FE791C5|nr:thiol-activated cytolysin family protein [Elizabethkingia occulta]